MASSSPAPPSSCSDSAAACCSVQVARPVEKVVQVVSEDASERLLFKFPDLSKGDEWDDDQPTSPSFPFPAASPSSSSSSLAAAGLKAAATSALYRMAMAGAGDVDDEDEDRLPLNPRCRRLLRAAHHLRLSGDSRAFKTKKKKKHAHLNHIANKVLKRFARGASSKSLMNRSKARLHLIAVPKGHTTSLSMHPYSQLV